MDENDAKSLIEHTPDEEFIDEDIIDVPNDEDPTMTTEETQ
jgi:hypothetical protein